MVQYPTISELDEGEIRMRIPDISYIHGQKPPWFPQFFGTFPLSSLQKVGLNSRRPFRRGGRQHRRALVKLDELARIQREHGELVDESLAENVEDLEVFVER